jgi:hypothetical protein
MHLLLSTRPGGHVEDGGQGVVRVAQTPGDIVVLSAADTTLSLLADAAGQLGAGYPTVRLANLMWLRQPASVDMYVDDVLPCARGGDRPSGQPSDWAYVVERARCWPANAASGWRCFRAMPLKTCNCSCAAPRRTTTAASFGAACAKEASTTRRPSSR